MSTSTRSNSKSISDEVILKRADSLVSPKKVSDDLDRKLIKRKMEKIEKKMQKYGKDQSEYTRLQKKYQNYQKTLKTDHALTDPASVTLEDALTHLKGKSPIKDVVSPSSSSRRSSSKRGKKILKIQQTEWNESPMSMTSTVCSPTELNESYVSDDSPLPPPPRTMSYMLPSLPLGQEEEDAPHVRVMDGENEEEKDGFYENEEEEEDAEEQSINMINPHEELFCKVFLQKDTDNLLHIGFVQLDSQQDSTFEEARQVIVDELVPDMIPAEMKWKFVVPNLGKVSKKQESRFGPMNFAPTSSTDTSNLGSIEQPMSLVIVETTTSYASTMSSLCPIMLPDSNIEEDHHQRSGQQSVESTENIEEHKMQDGDNNCLDTEATPSDDFKEDKKDEKEEKKEDEEEYVEPMDRSWRIHRAAPPPPSTPISSPFNRYFTKEQHPQISNEVEAEGKIQDDSAEETMAETSSSTSSRERSSHLRGYMRPESFDPEPNSKSTESPKRSWSPKGKKIPVAVFRTVDDENKHDDGQKLDITPPLEDVQATYASETGEQIEHAAEVPKNLLEAEDTGIVNKLHGFLRLGWKSKDKTTKRVSIDEYMSKEKKAEFNNGDYEERSQATEIISVEVNPRFFDMKDDSGHSNSSRSDDNAQTEGLLSYEKDTTEIPIAVKNHECGDDIFKVESKESIAEETLQSESEVEAVNKTEVEQDSQAQEYAQKLLGNDDVVVDVVVEDEFEEEVKTEDVVVDVVQEESEDEVYEVLVTKQKKLVMLVTLYAGNREVMPKQKRAISMLEGCNLKPELLDGSDPTNRERRNELFEVSGMRGEYPLFFVVEESRVGGCGEGGKVISSSTAFVGTFETIESRREEGTLNDILEIL